MSRSYRDGSAVYAYFSPKDCIFLVFDVSIFDFFLGSVEKKV